MKKVKFLKQTAAALMIAAIAFTGCKKEDNPVKVSGVSLNKTTLELTEGGSETLTATVTPADAENKAVTWTSDKPDVANVADGKVTAVKAGTATITVTTADGGKTATCAVTVNAATVSVTGVTLDKPTLTLNVGGTATLVATVEPNDAANKTVMWKSNNTGIATVDQNGKVTAVRGGAASITATTKDGAKTATCTVTVNGRITMTTAKSGEVSIQLRGSRDAVIDWGDGSEPETVALQTTSFTRHLHIFSNAISRTITIDGQNITDLHCDELQLTALDVTKNTRLTSLICSINQLTSLDVSQNTWLTHLSCSENQLTSLDVTKNTSLFSLYCDNNQLTNLDVTKNMGLYDLYCHNNQLTNLDITNNKLYRFYCHNNKLTSLDFLSNHTALVWLKCSYNKLTSLDVTKNIAMTILECDNNQLTSLNVTKNTALYRLECSNNQLTGLDVTNNMALKWLHSDGNQLTALDVTKNTVLIELYCSGNQLTADGLNALLGTLHSNAGTKKIYIGGNPGSANCNRTIATGKGWTVR